MTLFNRDPLLTYIKIICVSLFFLSSQGHTSAVQPLELDAHRKLNELYHSLAQLPKSDMITRVQIISGKFLGKPYILGALGEGNSARYDQMPRYRVDGFDCDTYVTTVLAIAFAHNIPSFQQCLSKIRYKNGHVDFISRNHFTSLDWNKNNQQQGFVKDITQSITDQSNKPVALMAEAIIDKPSWYQHFTKANIRLNKNELPEQEKRLAELKIKGSQLPKSKARIPYLPLAVLFDAQKKANQHLFSQIPDGAIIEIVRPNWDLTQQIGTHLNVSHLGFAFWKHGTLFFRQASSQEGGVVDIPLADYLRATLTSPTIKGINVQIIIPRQPLAKGC